MLGIFCSTVNRIKEVLFNKLKPKVNKTNCSKGIKFKISIIFYLIISGNKSSYLKRVAKIWINLSPFHYKICAKNHGFTLEKFLFMQIRSKYLARIIYICNKADYPKGNRSGKWLTKPSCPKFPDYNPFLPWNKHSFFVQTYWII